MQLKDVTEIIREILKERDKHPPTCKYNENVRAGLRKALRIIEQASVVDARSQWISVKDRLPKNFEDVVVFERWRGRVFVGCFDGDEWEVYGFPAQEVSYWMPLPEPPKREV